MSSSADPTPREPQYSARGVQLARAGVAAIAALMVTFSQDHSAQVGLAVFSGFAITTGIVWALAAWIVFPKGHRAMAVLMAIISISIGTAASVPAWRNVAVFFSLMIAWAALTGVVEIVSAVRGRRRARSDGRDTGESRDALTVGILGLLLAAVLPLVPMQYALDYYIDDAGQWFTLTGITIAVGVFGGYAAIVAVFLGIAGLSPRRPTASSASVRAAGSDAGRGGASGAAEPGAAGLGAAAPSVAGPGATAPSAAGPSAAGSGGVAPSGAPSDGVGAAGTTTTDTTTEGTR